jgi:hypothetical protein
MRLSIHVPRPKLDIHRMLDQGAKGSATGLGLAHIGLIQVRDRVIITIRIVLASRRSTIRSPGSSLGSASEPASDSIRGG